MHDSLEAWGSRDEAEEINRNENEPPNALHHLLAVDGRPCTPSGHEGGRERAGGRLGRLRVAGRMGASPAKLMGVENESTELPRGLPIASESASFISRVNGGGLVGFTGARREPRENQGRSDMQVGCKASSGTARATCSRARRPHLGGRCRRSRRR